MSPPPCRTLYLRNLPRFKKPKLRTLLRSLLTPHGKLVHLTISPTLSLQDQAFATYVHQSDTDQALKSLNNTTFHSKTLSVSYAKSLTDIAESPKLGGRSTLSRKQRKELRREARAEKAKLLEEERKKMHLMSLPDEAVLAADDPPPMVMPVMPVSAVIVVPNRILFVENLPKMDSDKDGDVKSILTELFAKYRGFVEVRTVPGKDGIAFVEFHAEGEAAVAMEGVQGRPLGESGVQISLSFAKK